MTATVSPLRRPLTWPERVEAYIRANPGCSSLDITLATHCVKVTARISDARAAMRERGEDIEAKRDEDGIYRYRVVRWEPEKPVQLSAWG